MTLKPTRFFVLLIVYFALLGCENESPENIAEIRCSLASKSLEALTGNLIFDRGYVHLNKVEVSGTKNGVAMNASTQFTDPEQFFFIGDDPRQPIKVPIAEAVYGNAEVNLYFFLDPYVLQLKDTMYLAPDPINEDDSDNDDGDEDDESNEDDEGDDDDGNEDDEEDTDDNEGDGDHDADEDDNEGESDDENENDEDSDDGDDDDDDNDNENEGEDDDDGRKSMLRKTVNLSDFIDHARPSIVLLGNFQNEEKNIKVLVAIDIASLQLVPLQSASDSLVVRKANEISAEATFQPGLWFGAITESEIINSSLINFRGETVLFIHKDFNAPLHAKIASAIEASTDLIFQVNGGF